MRVVAVRRGERGEVGACRVECVCGVKEGKKEWGEGHGEVERGGSFVTPFASGMSMTSLQNSPQRSSDGVRGGDVPDAEGGSKDGVLDEGMIGWERLWGEGEEVIGSKVLEG